MVFPLDAVFLEAAFFLPFDAGARAAARAPERRAALAGFFATFPFAVLAAGFALFFRGLGLGFSFCSSITGAVTGA